MLENRRLHHSGSLALVEAEKTIIGPDASSCEKGCIIIPIHPNEGVTLNHALSQYADRPDFLEGRLGILLYVNTTSTEDIASCPAMQSIETARQFYPQMPFISAVGHYQEIRLGTLRRDASILSIQRAKRAQLDLEKYLLIYHDADLMELPEGYFEQGFKAFENPQTSLMSALSFYRKEDYGDYETVLWLQRFVDVLSIYTRAELQYIRGEENNMWIRANTYLMNGGHDSARVSEAKNLINRIKKNDPSAVYATSRKQLRATYSPRRHLSTIRAGHLFADRYEKFCKSDDPVHETSVSGEENNLSQYAGCNKNTLHKELSEMYTHQLAYIAEKQIRQLIDTTGYPSLSDIQRICSTKHQDRVSVLQKRFKRCAGFLGITVEFNEHSLIIL